MSYKHLKEYFNMMLTLTADDFRMLSDKCQSEILNLLGYLEGNQRKEDSDDNEAIPFEDSYLRFAEEENYSSSHRHQENSSSSKRVIDITPEQASELIANISDKSIETLSRFKNGDPISLDDLYGDNRPYTNFSDLKRSFVGAVNRRLRTVTGNRQAVLFLTVKQNPSQQGTQISVRQATASSLSQAFEIVSHEKVSKTLVRI